MSRLSRIRNFCIIAHIDHGKSTLADRMLDLTHTIAAREARDQVLDDMDLERERGITIKAHPVTMAYQARDGHTYQFNLIDTPGHVDFSYEVTRSLAACEGALLVVDAAQGVEAQTVANTYLAIDQDLELIPVINKIDLPNANLDSARAQIEEVLGLDASEALLVSAKTGEGIGAVLEAVVARVPHPTTDAASDRETRALIFDSEYDTYRGAVAYVRVVDGHLRRGERVRFVAGERDYEVKEVGVFRPQPVAKDELRAGDVGYVVCNIKDASDIQIGDTITLAADPTARPLPGFKKIQPMVFTGLYPVDTADYEKLRFSLEKLAINDSAFTYMPESSAALGLGFRAGFLGLLHMEIIQERLRREYDLDIINTYPGVVYHIHLRNGTMLEVENPTKLPDPTTIDRIEEPIIKAHIICSTEHIGDVMQLILDRRGTLDHTDSIDGQRVMLTCVLPLNEILIDFHDKLKSATSGYASLDYEPAGYRADKLVKLDILVHHEPVEAFSSILHESKAESRGRALCQKLKEIIPPQMFAVPVQASIQSRIIARETIRALRKDVLAKCYGGDITRKRKLLEKQKEGKKRMKQIGQVNIPQEAFIHVLKS